MELVFSETLTLGFAKSVIIDLRDTKSFVEF